MHDGVAKDTEVSEVYTQIRRLAGNEASDGNKRACSHARLRRMRRMRIARAGRTRTREREREGETFTISIVKDTIPIRATTAGGIFPLAENAR